jgi:hypothetical protein
MSPDDDGFLLPSGVIARCSTSPSGSHTSATPYLAMQTLVSGLQDMFQHQAVTTQEDRQDHCRFEADIKAFLESAPSVADLPIPQQHSNPTHIGQYYSAPSRPSMPHSEPPHQRSGQNCGSLGPHYQVSPQPRFNVAPFHVSPFLTPPTKFTHCSKFKLHLNTSGNLLYDSLTSLELFFDGIKGSLDNAMITHYSFAPYMEWKEDHLLTTALCPPELNTHLNYTTMCIDYTAYGQVVYHHLHSDAVIGMTECPLAYHEIMALDAINCG